ncbi:MAG TPA: nucleotidyl transferase AbiEii/AbiGii toxin family protein [Candidatus Saccharimonadia bacterium]|nr:nucleotidyl transferase AbiEii/AbiGii toxin family protein [Candidatus Saccharimonadia bacterium]
MPSPSGVSSLVADLGRALEGVRWCLIGAQAAVIYGSTRATLDVDASVAIPEHERERLLHRLEMERFHPRIEEPLEFAARTRVLLLVHRPTAIPVDLVLAGAGIEEEFLARAHLIDLDGTNVPVISPEDLVASKMLAGRPRDLEDVESVLRRRRGVDLAEVRDLLVIFEQALDRSDLLTELDRIVGRIAKGPS